MTMSDKVLIAARRVLAAELGSCAAGTVVVERGRIPLCHDGSVVRMTTFFVATRSQWEPSDPASSLAFAVLEDAYQGLIRWPGYSLSPLAIKVHRSDEAHLVQRLGNLLEAAEIYPELVRRISDDQLPRARRIMAEIREERRA